MNASDLWNNRPPFLDTIPNAEKFRLILKHANKLLTDAGWTIDAKENKQEWKDFRDAVQDIRKAAKNQTGDPNAVVFPDPPVEV